MISAYDDEDNAPMFEDFPAPYMIRTWEEVQEEWNEREKELSVLRRESDLGERS